MVAWLNLDSAALEREYEISEEANGGYLFEPKDKAASPFASLEMQLASSGHLKRLIIHELSGDRIVMDFGDPKVARRK
jgi:hypothetical protein